LKIIWGIVVSAVLLVSIIGFDDSWAKKSQGVSNTRTMVDNVCGLDFCKTQQEIDEKISNYLKVVEKSSIDLIDNEGLENIVHIVKTSIVSKDLLLIHYSDGTWELINRLGFVDRLKKSQSESGKSQMEFGGTLDLGSEVRDTVGRLEITDTSVLRPLSDNVKEIKIYGNVGEKTLPYILLIIEFPHKPSQDFIMSVGENGNFDVGINIDKNTELGTYSVSGKYASAILGTVSFDIIEHEISMFGDTDEKIDSIELSTNRITIPSSVAVSFVLQVTGTLSDHLQGVPVELVLVSDNGEEFSRIIPASRDGTFFTFLNITPEFPEGVHSLVVRYRGEEVASTTLTATPSTLTLR